MAVVAPSAVDGKTPPSTPGDGELEGDCNADPPSLILQSAGGEQAGMISGFCIDNARLGCGICVDGRLLPNESFTVAHPGDELTIAMPGARLAVNPRCTPACTLEATVVPATCFEGQLLPADRLEGPDRVAQRTIISQDEPWVLAVAPGLYFVQVRGGEFVADDGWSGEAGGTFGLLVDPERERAIVDGASFYAACLARPSSDGGDSGSTEADGGVTLDGG